MEIVDVSLSVVERRLHAPFVTSRGSTSVARSVEVTLTDRDANRFVGESVPVAYVTGETIDTVLADLSTAAGQICSLTFEHQRPPLDSLAAMLSRSPSARCGVEMAAVAAWSHMTGAAFADWLGASLTSVRTDLTLPIVDNVAALAADAVSRGITTFKVKVGADPDTDFRRVDAAAGAAPGALFRIDANQGFTPRQALQFIDRLLAASIRLDMVEQPVARDDIAGLEFVAERSAVPIFADESVQTPAEARRLSETAVHGFNLKIQKCGIGGVLQIAQIARDASKELMIGCMLESRRAIGCSLAIAWGTGLFGRIDLDSHMLIDESGPNPYFNQTGDVLSRTSRTA